MLNRTDIAIIISALETAKVAVETSKKLEPETKTEFLNKINATIKKVASLLKETEE